MHSIGRAVRRLQTGLPVGLSDRDDCYSHAHIPTPCHAHKHFASQLAAGDQTLVSADSRPGRFAFQHELLAGRRAKPENGSYARVN